MLKRLRLNDKSVRECEPEAARDYQVFDTEVRGFSIRILRSGNRSFSLDYRFAGRQRRMAIERWPEWTETAACERAKDMRREIDEGRDPLGERSQLSSNFRTCLPRNSRSATDTSTPCGGFGDKKPVSSVFGA